MSVFGYQENIAGALDSTHIYYNISVTNPETGSTADADGNIVESTTNDKGLSFVFNQSRAAPYLKNPSQYYLSVIRFTVESPNIPVFCVQPVEGSSDRNKTIYTITITDADGTPYQTPVYWYPEDKTQKEPPVPITQASISPTNPYYYCYTYSYFIECVNFSIKTLWVDVMGQSVNDVPYMYFDSKTTLFTLGGPVSSFRTKANGDKIGGYSIYFNVALLNLVSSLPAKYVAGKVIVPSGSNLQMDYLMILSTGTDSTGTQAYITNVRTNSLTNNNDVYSTQEYVTLPLWTPITALVFKTTLLTTVPELVATPVVYENNNQNINAGKQNAEVLNVLAEHFAPQVTGTEYKPFIYYEPTGEYKLTDMYGKSPIDSIDIQAFWKDNYGNLVPFELGIGCSATIKILFRKKTFNSDNLNK